MQHKRRVVGHEMKKRILLSSVALLIGGMIYVLWRSESLLMFSWFRALGIGHVVETLRRNASPYANTFPHWVYFSLPQALWQFSGLLFFYSIWRNASTPHCLLWAGVFVAIAFGFEIGQFLGVVPGYFETWDLILLIAACLLAWAVVGFTPERRIVA